MKRLFTPSPHPTLLILKNVFLSQNTSYSKCFIGKSFFAVEMFIWCQNFLSAKISKLGLLQQSYLILEPLTQTNKVNTC